MNKNITISLGDHFEKFVKSVVDTGRYNNASEVVKAALNLLEQEEIKRKSLRQALIEGEESGYIEDFDPELLLDQLHKKHN